MSRMRKRLRVLRRESLIFWTVNRGIAPKSLRLTSLVYKVNINYIMIGMKIRAWNWIVHISNPFWSNSFASMSISVKRLFFADTLLLRSEFELFFEFMTIPKAQNSLKKRYLISLKKYQQFFMLAKKYTKLENDR